MDIRFGSRSGSRALHVRQACGAGIGPVMGSRSAVSGFAHGRRRRGARQRHASRLLGCSRRLPPLCRGKRRQGERVKRRTGVVAGLSMFCFAFAGVAGAAPTLQAGSPSARVEGVFKVVLTPLTIAGTSGTGQWTIRPKCSSGACSVSVVARAWKHSERGKVRKFAANFNGRSYEATSRGFDGCVTAAGEILVEKGYRVLAIYTFRVTASASAGATAFTGTLVTQNLPTEEGASRGCPPSTQRSRLTGYLQ